jgi:hypothetical protein
MFVKLLFAHLIADFVLQNNWLVRRKLRWDGLFLHAGLVFLAMAIVAWDEIGLWGPWLICLAILHAVTDWTKLCLERRCRLLPIIPFLGDQVVHIGAVFFVVLLHSTLKGQPLLLSQLFTEGALSWWIADLYISCTFAASIALPIWMSPGSLVQRPSYARWTTILAGAFVLTLSWQGLILLILPVAACFYGLAVHWQDHTPTMSTLRWEVLSTVILAIGAGWALH